MIRKLLYELQQEYREIFLFIKKSFLLVVGFLKKRIDMVKSLIAGSLALWNLLKSVFAFIGIDYKAGIVELMKGFIYLSISRKWLGIKVLKPTVIFVGLLDLYMSVAICSRASEICAEWWGPEWAWPNLLIWLGAFLFTRYTYGAAAWNLLPADQRTQKKPPSN